jgi:pimeloyl-ACP methyl ester carboxylesterase
MVNTLTPRKELLEPITELILQAHPNGVIGSLKGMAERHDLTGDLSNITVPAVVIAGESDQLVPHDRMETMAQMLPKGWLVSIPNAGHMLMMEDPQAVAAHLRQLIQMAKMA